mmetsp:Transcript_10911/g.26726  ORF Transcript_10911/g.26726 Transcript_10911/m.26726 type:complete len:307 (+) Transcript_10911:1048-1968(+)
MPEPLVGLKHVPAPSVHIAEPEEPALAGDGEDVPMLIPPHHLPRGAVLAARVRPLCQHFGHVLVEDGPERALLHELIERLLKVLCVPRHAVGEDVLDEVVAEDVGVEHKVGDLNHDLLDLLDQVPPPHSQPGGLPHPIEVHRGAQERALPEREPARRLPRDVGGSTEAVRREDRVTYFTHLCDGGHDRLVPREDDVRCDLLHLARAELARGAVGAGDEGVELGVHLVLLHKSRGMEHTPLPRDPLERHARSRLPLHSLQPVVIHLLLGLLVDEQPTPPRLAHEARGHIDHGPHGAHLPPPVRPYKP